MQVCPLLTNLRQGSVVGQRTSSYIHTELPLRALDMTLSQRIASGVIHHSDQGHVHVDHLRTASPRSRCAAVDGRRRWAPSVTASVKFSSDNWGAA